MFLNRLNSEEKVKFLRLAYSVAVSDETITNEEELMIFRYCSEMKIADIDFDSNLYDLKRDLSTVKDPVTQKIFLLEIMALVYADEKFQTEEQNVIEDLVEVFNLNPSLVVVYTQWAKSMLSLQIQGEALINL